MTRPTTAAARPSAARSYVVDLLAVLRRAGDRAVLRCAGADTSGTGLLAAISRSARALGAAGIGPGDLVALLAPNRPDALAVRYAAHLLGAGTAYLPAPPDPDRRRRTIAQFEPRLLVVFPETAHLVPAGLDVDLAAVGPVPGVRFRLDLAAAGQPAAPLPSRAGRGDLAVVISSGGTTGVPRGSRRDVAAYTAMVTGPPAPGRRRLVNGSLAHLTQVLVDQTLLGGGTVVLQDRVDPAATLAAIEAERITDLFLVEPQLVELMDSPDVGRYDLGSLESLVHIGALAAPVLRRRARARLGPVVAHAYGSSEVGIVSALTPAEHDRPSRFACAGRVHPGVEVRFRRADGALDPAAGAIEVRSPAMAQGYRHRPVDEAERFVDGWYRTGDLGCLDDEGMLRVLGRAADAGGPVGVPPVALQETLCRLPSVRYAVPVTDLERGVRLAAVEPWPGGSVDVASCRAAVVAAHGPAVGAALRVLPVERVPLTEQGKPDRAAIRAAALSAGAPGSC
ncbi:class I adenylate-forming enzyme family protein [Blastococcus sp. SYSU D00695]